MAQIDLNEVNVTFWYCSKTLQFIVKQTTAQYDENVGYLFIYCFHYTKTRQGQRPDLLMADGSILNSGIMIAIIAI